MVPAAIKFNYEKFHFIFIVIDLFLIAFLRLLPTLPFTRSNRPDPHEVSCYSEIIAAFITRSTRCFRQVNEAQT